MISAVNPAVSATKAVATQNVTTTTTPVELKKGGRKSGTYASIDEKQNDNVLMELNYIGTQLKALLDIQAGKSVKVSKTSNKLPEDEFKTPEQKQKDDAIVELGYIGDVLKKMVDVKQGNLEETVDKSSKRVRV
jgi:hypothetical protein